jgi:glutamate-1-semialdehyde 2,1-aminomutase
MDRPVAYAPRTGNDFYGAVTARQGETIAEFRALTPKSGELAARAAKVFPGGFTRDAFMRTPYAPFVTGGTGTQLTDADGRQLTDLWFNATSLALGHAHPLVVQAVQAQAAKGTAYYAPTEHELLLAELLTARIPSFEQIRFANSGSEAVMMALRFARAKRNSKLIVKFEGSYHGSYDDVAWSVSPQLAKAGAAEAPNAVADTGGLAAADGRVTVLPFNDAAVLHDYVETHHADIAGLIVEPMANRMGLLMPDPAFLAEARALCDKYGIVLIFDEVIAFRVGYRGAQGAMGVAPDLTTLGKIIGGGFPVGAVAGRRDILALSAPGQAGRVAHAGTFNGNPMTAVAGYVTMQALTPEVFERIGALGAYVRQRLGAITDGLPLQVTGTGSLFKITATDRPIHNYRDAATANKLWESTVSLALLNAGFLMTPTLSGCVSAVTTQAELDAFLDTFERIVYR